MDCNYGENKREENEGIERSKSEREMTEVENEAEQRMRREEYVLSVANTTTSLRRRNKHGGRGIEGLDRALRKRTRRLMLIAARISYIEDRSVK